MSTTILPDLVSRRLALRLLLEGLSYRQIGARLGKSGARIYQLLAPPPILRREVADRAHGRCERCGIQTPRGHVHSSDVQREVTGYMGDGPLTYLCLSCARIAHAEVETGGMRLCGECLEQVCEKCGQHKGRGGCKLAGQVCECGQKGKRDDGKRSHAKRKDPKTA